MVRERLSLDQNWRFHLGDLSNPIRDFGFGIEKSYAKAGEAGGALKPGFNDMNWRPVNLPHDWVVELPFDPKSDCFHGFKPVGRNFPEYSVGWYRRHFNIPKEDLGKRLSIEFDGVFRDCSVWLNGHEIGRQESGYSSFYLDITDYINYGGENVLVVRVDLSHFEGWFYEGGGIYRHVWLVKTDPLHIARWGTFVNYQLKENQAEVTAKTKIINESDLENTCEIISIISSPDGMPLTETTTQLTMKPWEEKEIAPSMIIANPQRWDIDSPLLYKLITRIITKGEEIDRYETPFGFRSFYFDPDKGFFLNGRRVMIQGTCNHQDHAGVGSALPDRLQYYRIEKLKEMGCNAYRTSHNPPTPELLEACDKLGMLVMDEHRLVGSSPEILGQLERMVLRDRNHPSIILWSMGNEEWVVQGTEPGARLLTSMKRLVKKLDPTRPVTVAMNGEWGNGFSKVVDVQGCNYLKAGDYDKFHKENPTIPMIGSEEASTLCTRGTYANDKEHGYMSAYDDNSPSWGTTAEYWWKYYQERPYIAGGFVWTGFDYRGEPTPYQWPCINSHFGIMDTCGFPKDNYFYYQSWWSTKTVLHLLPHWNWPGKEGQEIDVRCFSNCQEVELFLNGQTLGKQSMPKDSHLEWKVKYAPGTLLAKGFRDGKEIAETKIETTGEPVAIKLSPDRSPIKADGEDLCMVEISAVDSTGRMVPIANNDIQLEIKGNGKIIGVGNGDPSSHESDKNIIIPTNLPITRWKMKFVDGVEDRPEIAENYIDSKWDNISVDNLSLGKESSVAVYRTFFILPESEIRGNQINLTFGQIDDEGWIYLNGKKIGETRDWSQSYNFDITEILRTGKNNLAVIVRNNAGPGGIGKGVSLEINKTIPWKRKLFNGLAQVIIQSDPQAGVIELTASSPGLEKAILNISTEPITPRPAVP